MLLLTGKGNTPHLSVALGIASVEAAAPAAAAQELSASNIDHRWRHLFMRLIQFRRHLSPGGSSKGS
jgi:hypothetical protein